MSTPQDAASPTVAGLSFEGIERRRGFRIDPAFQTRFRTMLLAFAVLIILAVGLMALAVRWVAANPGDLLMSLWVPGAFFGMAVAIVAVSFHLADRISHRYCGPVRRITHTLEAARRGERPRPIKLRQNDEFQELAEAINATLASLGALDD